MRRLALITAVTLAVAGGVAFRAHGLGPAAAPRLRVPARVGLAPRGPVDKVSPAPAASCDAHGRRSFTLLHFNDTQARYSHRVAGRSRFGYLAGYLRWASETGPSLVLDAGDDYEKGAITELRSDGEATRRALALLPIDARTIGNHDFAYGEDALLRDVGESAHPVLAANLTRRDGGPNPFQSYAAFTVGCVRVGVIGLVTQAYGADDRPTAAPYLGVFHHDADYAKVLEEQVQAHRGEVDVLVALTHLGYWTDLALAQRTSGVDLFVGGHSEDRIAHPPAMLRRDGRRAWVLQAGHFAEALGRGEVTVTPDGGGPRVNLEGYRLVDVTPSMPFADDVGREIDALEAELTPGLATPVGNLRGTVSASAMGSFVLGALQELDQADALVLGGDAFWSGLPAGPVTLQRLYDAVLVQRQPAGSSGFTSLRQVTLTGRELGTLGGRVLGLRKGESATKTYRVAVEKRAFEGAPGVFGTQSRDLGELVDVLEAFARRRTAEGRSLDEPRRL